MFLGHQNATYRRVYMVSYLKRKAKSRQQKIQEKNLSLSSKQYLDDRFAFFFSGCSLSSSNLHGNLLTLLHKTQPALYKVQQDIGHPVKI